MRTVMAILLAGAVAASQAPAAIPLQVNYQGRVAVGGTPFTGNGLFRFTIADRTTSITLWCNDNSRTSQTANLQPVAAVNLPVINGLFNVRLGDTTIPNMRALPSTVFDRDRVTLRVWFDDQLGHGSQLLLPDQPIISVAYAFHALRADSAGIATTANSAATALRATTATLALDSSRLQGLAASLWQRRVVGIAPPSQFLRAINADGSVVMGTTATAAWNANRAKLADTATTATNANRLGGLGANSFQRRVTGAAPVGQYIRAINADGSIVTGIDQDTPGPPAWLLAGNSGTTPGTDFLGTLDPVPFEIRVNNMAALHIHPAADSPNLIAGSPVNAFNPLSVMGATISGGGGMSFPNRVSDNFGTIGGGKGNQAGDGDPDADTARFATVGGGEGNRALGYGSTVGGGVFNSTSGTYATVGGGLENQTTSQAATVAGGIQNVAASAGSSIGGGGGNVTSGPVATIAGGFGNTASGYAATVPGGEGNFALGDCSFAAGNQAMAQHPGAFVWASGGLPFASTGNNQFLIDAPGGVGIGTNTPAPFALRVAGSVGIDDGLNMGADETPAEITNVSWPTTDTSAATKEYVDKAARMVLVPNSITGCELEWVSLSTIRVAPGSIELKGEVLTSGTHSPNLIITNMGLWLNGTPGPDTWIYVYLRAQPPVWSVYLSNEPPNCSDALGRSAGTLRYRNYGGQWYRCVGAVRTNSEAEIRGFFQRGNLVMYDVPVNITTSPTATGWSPPRACTAAVPAISTLGVFGLAAGDTDSVRAGIWIRPNGSTWDTRPQNGIYYVVATPAAIEIGGQRVCAMDSMQRIQYQNDVGDDSTSIDVEGYYLDIR